jgi:clan AA aspartic protease
MEGVRGETRAKLTLVNVYDKALASAGVIKEAQIRAVEVEALVDTGASTLVIPESLRAKLGLGIEESSSVMLADGKTQACTVAGAVEILWNDRRALDNPIVLSGESDEVLLGVLPLERMDLIVDVVHHCLTGAHGDKLTMYVR